MSASTSVPLNHLQQSYLYLIHSRIYLLLKRGSNKKLDTVINELFNEAHEGLIITHATTPQYPHLFKILPRFIFYAI